MTSQASASRGISKAWNRGVETRVAASSTSGHAAIRSRDARCWGAIYATCAQGPRRDPAIVMLSSVENRRPQAATTVAENPLWRSQ